MRASIRPTRSRIGAVNSPTTVVSGETITPTSCARMTSTGGSLARVSTSSAVSDLPSSTPPRIASTFVLVAASRSAFATATGSPSDSTNAIADGPSSSASSASAPAASAARRVSVFLTTEKRAPCSSSFERRPSISAFVSPR